MIRVAMIGFGGIAKAVHFPAYKKLEEKGVAQLIAACDIEEKAFVGKAEINIGSSAADPKYTFVKYTDWREMLANEKVDMVDICLPTYLHADIACEVLEMGYHVLSEKPMAIDTESAQRMLASAEKSGKRLMIGQCLRFGNNYRYLKELIEKGTYGKVKAGMFRRFSSPPVWAWNNWYMDITKSGGAIQDLHVHDLDIIRYLLGDPEAVSCDTADFYAGDDVAYSRLHYKDGVTFLR